MKIKTNYDECPYITAGKEYEASRDGSYLKIVDDEGDAILIKIESCAHLGGHDWQLAQEERFSQEVAQEMYEFIKHVANGRSDYFGDARRLLTKLEKNDDI